MKIKRAILKLSGEVFGDGDNPIIFSKYEAVAKKILKIVEETKIELAVVIGGGNIFRGLQGTADGMDRVQGDYMGMLATVINSLALQDALEKRWVDTRVQSAMEMREVAEPFIRRRAIRHLEKGRVVIPAGGTGRPSLNLFRGASSAGSVLTANWL